MAFLLENFDLHISPELIAQGQKLYEKNAVIHKEEVEKNLWSFEVRERKVYEIEILVSPKKVLNYSCDCSKFKANQECKHIASALFDLRMAKTKPITRGPQVVRSVPKKLSIPNLLNQIEPDDLKVFIRNYSRKNKKFSTALKASFARKVDIENNEEKYEGILNSIIKPATEVDHKISHQRIRQFISVADKFDAQFEDSISLKQYTEAFYIIKALLSKVSYVNHWTASEHEEILDKVRHFHKQFRLLLDMPIAPSLRRSIIDFGSELAGRSYYHVTHAEHNLLLILLDPAGLQSKRSRLQEILMSKLNSVLLHDGELQKLWIIRQYYIEKNIDLKKTTAPVLSSQAVYSIVDRLMEFKAYKGLKNFIELFEVNGHLKDSYLSKSYMKLLLKIGDQDEVIAHAHAGLFLFKDIFYYRTVQRKFPESSSNFFENIQEKIASKRSFEYQSLYLDLLAHDERTAELIDYLIDSRYALRHIYDRAAFIKRNSNQLSKVLIRLSDQYLSEYLGKESSNEMRKLLVFLRKNNWEKELNTLQRHLLKDYEDRQSLQTEIQDF
ncbi:SWIM zinc finger family protein [Portibacter marinus]|uniref:SWIM zinc finger family protein n=1 Tax=Portibacter marinus TaxID=2898660 RepID=UPI001F42C8F9|nr:hypothetical protein [Portibacter marinus]